MSEKQKSKWQTIAEQSEQSEQSEQAESTEQQPASDERPESSEPVVDELTQPEGLAFPSREQLEDQLTAMERKVDQYQEMALRARADADNAQRLAQRDVANARKFGSERLIADLLPVADCLTRGLEGIASANQPNDDAAAKGLQLTLDLLEKTLVNHGVSIIDPAKGDHFNPDKHEAMSMQPDPDAKPNTILQVLQRGYELNGRVLRAAMVIVVSS